MSDTPFVRPDVAAFLAYLNAVPGPKMHELEAPAARAVYTAMKDVADLPVGELGASLDLTIPGPTGDIPARLFDVSATREPGPVVVFFHGGGFVIGNVDTHASLCAQISRLLDLPVVSVEYRLAPEHPWPAAPDDCEAAARWIATGPAALGRGVTGLVLSGDSAGGALTITTSVALRDEPAAVPVLVQAPLYPAADAAREYPSYSQFAEGYLLTRPGMDWFMAAYQPDLAHPRASPLAGDLAGLPPAVVMTASLDPIRDQGRAYAAALIGVGVTTIFQEAVGNIHGFATLRKAVPSSEADIASFLASVRGLVEAATA